MKYCPRCEQTQPESNFYIKVKSTGQLNSYCKPCQKLFSKEDYQNNKTSYVDRAKRHAAARKEQNLAILNVKRVCCVRCGEDDPCALDMHHTDPSVKEFNLSSAIANVNTRRFQAELDKCIVLCASCHRKYHAGRFEL